MEQFLKKLKKIDVVTEENANQVISLYDEYISKFEEDYDIPEELNGFYFEALAIKKEYQKLIEEIDNGISNIEQLSENELKKFELETGFSLSECYKYKAEVLKEMNRIYDSIVYFKKALKYSKSTTEKFDIRDKINSLLKIYNEEFLNIPLTKRKLVVLDQEFKPSNLDNFIVLDKNNLPNKVNFPNSGIKEHELYIVHPYVNDSYLSFKNYETELSIDKINEYFYFIQCLGAKKISYKIFTINKKGEAINSESKIDLSLGFGKSVIKTSGKAAFQNETKINSQDETFNAHSKTQIFHPTKSPYLPEDLIWYHQEPSWQRLYQQRINGNLAKHDEIISSKSIKSIDNIEQMNIEIAFKNLFIDSNLNINNLIENTFNQDETINYEIEIEFESISNLK